MRQISGACGALVATVGRAVATVGRAVATVSWPGLARPPTTLPLQHRQSWMAGTRPAMTQWDNPPVILTPMRRRLAIHALLPHQAKGVDGGPEPVPGLVPDSRHDGWDSRCRSARILGGWYIGPSAGAPGQRLRRRVAPPHGNRDGTRAGNTEDKPAQQPPAPYQITPSRRHAARSASA
jgi:hypothetical protein